ncbi:glycosyltransferase family 2 protein [Paracoccus sp. S1E-3]|uniref:glycosyltransferase family 2 protein n=1 Tax=Paracoccus sp. S1E-3 TaxID=2756130 RepID=UPI0015EF3BDB|nr:glycosyltransferase family 2 protein [Paracoccus sp. S1E-3]MBA4489204.1 glycosyltransferase [Paracoccus sp. S1E-3]
MSKPFLLSIVIPNRNRAQTLLRALLSLEGQTADELDIVVVDDASETDLSDAYALAEKMGARVLRQPRHLRGSAARNRGVTEARGTHVSFLDSDDIWLPGRYDDIKAFFARPENDRQVLISGALLHVGGEIRPTVQPPWKPGRSLVEYVYRDGARVQTSMLTMPVDIARAHPFDETLRVNQDTDLAMRLDRAGIGFTVSPLPALVKEETPRTDRLTTDNATVEWSHAWYLRESHDWSAAAKSGYHLQDRVWRLADAGRKGQAMLSLGRTLFPPVSARETARRAITLALGDRGYTALRRVYRKTSGDKAVPERAAAVLRIWQELDRRSKEMSGG